MICHKSIYHNLHTSTNSSLSLRGKRERKLTAIATKVNTAALILPVRSVLKLRRPIAKPPRTTVNCSHDKKVRSFAKNTVRRQTRVNHPGTSYLLVLLGLGAQFWSL